jgi:hypothetical protein
VTAEEQVEEVVMIYAGRRMSKTKTFYAYVLEDARTEADEKWYGSKLHPTAKIGQAFAADRVITDDPESFKVRFIGGSDAAGRLRESSTRDSDMRRWEGADAAVAVMLAKLARDRKIAKEGPPSQLDYAFKILQDAYKAQRGIPARVAFMQYVDTRVREGR